MKTIKNLLFVAFAAMTIAACQKEFENPEGGVKNSGKVVNFTASMDDAQTKTTIWYEEGIKDALEEGLEEVTFPTRFMNGDSVMVNGVSSGLAKATGTLLSFSVKGVEPPYYAVSANQVAKVKDGGYVYDPVNHQYNITFGANQKYRLVKSKTNITFDSPADVFAAYSEDETLKFKHLSTFLLITVNNDLSTDKTNIKNIYVSQGDGGNIAGEWYVKYDENNVPCMEPGSLTNDITYACVVRSDKEESNFSPDGVPQGNPMIIGLPAYNYDNGLLVALEDMNGNFSVFKIPATKTQFAEQGGAVIPFNPSFDPVVRETISSAEEWNSFATYVNATSGKGATGTIKLTTSFEAENLKQITNFKGVFDGDGNTITQTNATKPLFGTVSGEIKNLTLAGALNLASESGAPLVNKLASGGRISGCVNRMTVTCRRNAHTYVGGLVSYMESAAIVDCTNEGTLSVEVGVDSKAYNVAVAGIVADVRIPDADADRNVILENCKNIGALTLYPAFTKSVTSTTVNIGMSHCGMGGIAGWVRNSAVYTFTNCDNEGEITLSASKITTEKGNIAKTICVGGILGIAAPCKDGLMMPNDTTLYKVTLTNCDNSGLVYNQGVNYSSRGETNNKVFTGGLAGALAGVQSTHSQVVSCSNTGKVITHDFVSGMEGVTPSTRPNYCCVAGGLVGYGAFLDMDDVTVKCQIGNGKRQMAAWGGVIGFAIKKFSLKNSDVDVSGHFASYPGYDANRAVVAVVPVQDGAKTSNLVPNVADSEISNNTIKCLLHTFLLPSSQDSKGSMKTSDLSNEQYVTTISTAEEITSNLVCGEGFTANSGIIIGDGTTDNNTYIVGTAN